MPAEVGILEADLADPVVALAGVCDLIVHLYAELDDDRLAMAVRYGGPADLDVFARRIAGSASGTLPAGVPHAGSAPQAVSTSSRPSTSGSAVRSAAQHQRASQTSSPARSRPPITVQR